MGIRIVSTGSYLPQTSELVRQHAFQENPTTPELALLFSGAKMRRICRDFETPTYMGIQAARAALEAGNVDPRSIQAVLCYSGIEDNVAPKDVYGMLPEIGCDGAMAWAIDTACASFLTHLHCANALSLTGIKRFLIIDSMNWVNRAFSENGRSSGPGSLVGDGAGAVVAETVEGRGSIIDTIEKTSSADFDFIKMGSAQLTGNREYLTFTKSHRIIHRALSILPETAQELLCRNEVSADDVRWTLTHQPGLTAITKWHEGLKISTEKNLNTFSLFGNMSAANIPVTLDYYLTTEPRIRRGDLILAFTAGAGIHCVATLLEY